jgi:hypothetical protein
MLTRSRRSVNLRLVDSTPLKGRANEKRRTVYKSRREEGIAENSTKRRSATIRCMTTAMKCSSAPW